jgi:DNA-binding transcriptional LysR family regulator
MAVSQSKDGARSITFRQLRYFLAVAEHLHFRRAAEYVHLTQPALTLQIRALEEELGVKLLERNQQGTGLTYAGATFRDGAQELLKRLDRATERTVRAAHGKIGLLRIGFISTAPAAQIVPALVSCFHKTHPHVELTLQSLPTSEQLAMLQHDGLDIGFFRLPVTENDEIQTIALFQEPLVVLLPAHHSLARKRNLKLQDLKPFGFIMYAREHAPGYHDSIMRMLNDIGFNPIVTQEAGEMYTLVSLVSAGLGISVAPLSVKSYRLPGIVTRRIAGMPPAQVAMGVRRRNRHSDTEDFISLALQMCRAGVWKKASSREIG